MDADLGDLSERCARSCDRGRDGGQLGSGVLGEPDLPSLLDAIGETATFFLFAAMCVIGFIWIKRKVPETKGKSLEEIQQVWAEHDQAQVAGSAPVLHTD